MVIRIKNAILITDCLEKDKFLYVEDGKIKADIFMSALIFLSRFL